MTTNRLHFTQTANYVLRNPENRQSTINPVFELKTPNDDDDYNRPVKDVIPRAVLFNKEYYLKNPKTSN